jgi:2-polyprenyl-3-methyl-5-hydroxy-6-metoxy-1,4-benzoquinol methylase
MSMRQYWEKVYNSKQLSEVSWYQPIPAVSLAFLEELAVAKDAAIIDVGGGDSLLADQLLEKGYSDITVLDISSAAIGRPKKGSGGKRGG